MYSNRSFVIILLITLLPALTGCRKKPVISEDVIVRAGDKELTTSEVIALIPEGVLPADSINMFQAIVETWIKDNVLSDFAEEHLYDLREIDRKVKQYRDMLIIEEYLRKMKENHKTQPDAVSVREYYDKHRSELKTEIPLVKGVFLKVSAEAKDRNEISRLLNSDDPSKIDDLEKKWLDAAISYDYFQDRWVDWENVSGLIPHRFGNPDLFLSENTYFEKEYGDCVYYLKITDYLPSGSEQPFEYASGWISGVLSHAEIRQYEQTLVNSLIKKAIQENKLELIGYSLTEKKETDIEK